MISVVIPLYNKEASIANTLNCVLAQTYQDFEIVVVDDGSTDNSAAIVETFKDPRIRLIHQPNGGVSAARNTGVREAKGGYIAFLDADDEWDQDYLATLYSMISSMAQCGIFATNYRIKYENGKIESTRLNNLLFSGCGQLTNYFDVASSSNPPLWTSAVCVRKDALLSVEGFPVGIKSGEDLLTWAKLASRYMIAYCTSPKATFVQDPTHAVNKKPTRPHDEIDYVGNGLIGLLEHVEQRQLSGLRHYISMWYKMRTSVNLRLNDKKGTWSYGIKSLKYNPRNWKVYLMMALVLMPSFVQSKIKNAYVR